MCNSAGMKAAVPTFKLMEGTMPIPSTADHKRVDSMERGVLSRLRVAYEALHEASVLVDQNKNVLSRYGSALADVTSDGPKIVHALEAVNAIGGQLHAYREVSFPEDNESYEAMETYLNALDAAREKWMDTEYYVTLSRATFAT
jgi:hypothetical protein